MSSTTYMNHQYNNTQKVDVDNYFTKDHMVRFLENF